MNTNEESNLMSDGLESTTMEGQQDVIWQIIDNSEELNDLSDVIENDVGDILGDGEAVKTLEEKYAESLNELKKLQDQIKTLTSVAATSQSQYISLKAEFESAQRMRTLEKARDKVSAIIAVAKKFVILTEYMRQFLAHLTPDLTEHDLIKWLQLSYDKFISTELAGFGIKQIESLWITPDSELHEVVMIDTVTESDIAILNSLGHEWSDFAGRIIREFEVGYYYMDGETRHIIKAAKVVVGQ